MTMKTFTKTGTKMPEEGQEAREKREPREREREIPYVSLWKRDRGKYTKTRH